MKAHDDDVAPDAAAVVDDDFTAAMRDLEKGKTCAVRKAAVERLRALGDARAVPALKKARYRMRGGLIGIGSSNSNACLKAAADAAIAELSADK